MNALGAAFAAAALVSLAPAASAQAERTGYKTKAGEWVWVDSIEYRVSTDAYHVTKKGGSYDVKRLDVDELEIPRPSDFNRYVPALKGPAPDAASVQAMENIVQQYTMLVWDTEGLKLLIPVYVQKGEFDKILKSCDTIRSAAGNKLPESLLPSYWTALLKTGKTARVREELTQAIETGSRAAAAAAYLVRGDLLEKEGKRQEACYEGYMRTVMMFGDIRALQPEALFKTWKALRAAGDPRAKKFGQKLLDDYRSSSYAQQLD